MHSCSNPTASPFICGTLVSEFHRFYHDHRIISDDAGLTQARLLFIKAVKTVIKNGLTLLGVNAPESM